MSAPLHPVTIGIFSLTAVVVISRFLRPRKTGPLPPGPRKLPLIGNLFGIPRGRDWETYAKWSKEYNSDIIHVEALGTSMVILNTYEAAQELLEKRSSIYSSRPHMTMFHELSGWGFQFPLLPYGDRWKASRRMFTQYFAPSNYEASHASETFHTRRFLRQLLKQPEDFMRHIRHMIGGIAVSMSYGIDTKAENDPYIALVEAVAEASAELLVPGNFYVDFLPVLKYLPQWTPGAYFHQKGKLLRDYSVQVREGIFEAAKKLIDSGRSQPSFISENLKELDNLNEKEKQDELRSLLMDTASIVYLAAADTTASALSTFFLAMTCYPEVQRKAKAEVDSVVQGRLPEHDDLAKLPYLSAVVKETLRWATVVPLGLPHLVTVDDVYKGYHIPANTIILANQWAMAMDENEYPNPEEFIPERFLCNGKVDPTVRDPAETTFGFGRRICPGRHLALSTLMLVTASVLSTFDIAKQKDDAGNDIEPEREYNNQVLNKPLPFPCIIKPRSSTTYDLVHSTLDEDD